MTLNQLWVVSMNSACRFSGMVIFLFLSLNFNNIASASEPMAPGPYKAPLKYALLLPPYCGGLYFQRTEPQYRMPPRELCGVRTNHFCSGLMDIYRAREATNSAQKARSYRSAKKHVEYTRRGIADFPRCPLHRDVNNALMEIEAALMVFK